MVEDVNAVQSTARKLLPSYKGGISAAKGIVLDSILTGQAFHWAKRRHSAKVVQSSPDEDAAA